jgi:hypothetical protein
LQWFDPVHVFVAPHLQEAEFCDLPSFLPQEAAGAGGLITLLSLSNSVQVVALPLASEDVVHTLYDPSGFVVVETADPSCCVVVSDVVQFVPVASHG